MAAIPMFTLSGQSRALWEIALSGSAGEKNRRSSAGNSSGGSSRQSSKVPKRVWPLISRVYAIRALTRLAITGNLAAPEPPLSTSNSSGGKNGCADAAAGTLSAPRMRQDLIYLLTLLQRESPVVEHSASAGSTSGSRAQKGLGVVVKECFEALRDPGLTLDASGKLSSFVQVVGFDLDTHDASVALGCGYPLFSRVPHSVSYEQVVESIIGAAMRLLIKRRNGMLNSGANGTSGHSIRSNSSSTSSSSGGSRSGEISVSEVYRDIVASTDEAAVWISREACAFVLHREAGAGAADVLAPVGLESFGQSDLGSSSSVRGRRPSDKDKMHSSRRASRSRSRSASPSRRRSSSRRRRRDSPRRGRSRSRSLSRSPTRKSIRGRSKRNRGRSRSRTPSRSRSRSRSRGRRHLRSRRRRSSVSRSRSRSPASRSRSRSPRGSGRPRSGRPSRSRSRSRERVKRVSGSGSASTAYRSPVSTKSSPRSRRRSRSGSPGASKQTKLDTAAGPSDSGSTTGAARASEPDLSGILLAQPQPPIVDDTVGSAADVGSALLSGSDAFPKPRAGKRRIGIGACLKCGAYGHKAEECNS